MAGLDTILETTTAERPATGFVFTEGPLWHPDGYYYFADVRSSVFYRLRLGQAPETVRTGTGEGNGTTFDLQGRLVICEGGNRRVTRWSDESHTEVVMDRYEGKRINRPNDVVCKSDGSIWFTDPGLRVPLADKELPHSGVYAVKPDGTSRLVAEFEYPNGLAFSPDERVLYIANTRHAQYIHAIELDSAGNMVRRRIFADMSSEETDGVPDGMKVDVEGRVYCTGPGGTWVFAPDGRRLGIIRTPEIPANLCFGGPDLKTLFFTARTSVYTLRGKHPASRTPGTACERDKSGLRGSAFQLGFSPALRTISVTTARATSRNSRLSSSEVGAAGMPETTLSCA
jgi:gluconolactonase